MKYRKLAVLALPLVLGACQPGTSTSGTLPSYQEPTVSEPDSSVSSENSQQSTPSSETYEEPDLPAASVKDYLDFFAHSRDYEWRIEELNTQQYVCTYYFTPDAIGSDVDGSDQYTSLAVYDGTGVFTLGRLDGELVSSEYLKKADGTGFDTVWDDELTPTMYGKNQSFIDSLGENLTQTTIKDKTYKLSLLSALGYGVDYLMDMGSIDCEIIDGVFSMTFDLTSSMKLKITAQNLQTAEASAWESFKAEGGTVFTPNQDLSDLRRLFMLDNFINKIESGDTAVYEMYNQKYFLSCTAGSDYTSGYVELNDRLHGRYGCYSVIATGEFSDQGNAFTSDFTIYTNTPPYYNTPSIEDMYHYPSRLKLWNNLQYVKTGVHINLSEILPEPNGVAYNFDNQELLLDFAQNFSIDQNYPTNRYAPMSVTIDMSLGEDDASSQIDLYYCLTDVLTPGSYGVIKYSFSNFGNADVPELDAELF